MTDTLTQPRPILLALMFFAGLGYLLATPVTTGAAIWMDVAATVGVLVLFLLLFVPLQIDRRAPDWLKNLSALALFVLLAATFFRWANADWGRLGHLFFNFEVMSRPGVMLRMLSGLWIAVQVFLFSLVLATCSIPDDHIDLRRSAFFMARSVLRDIRTGSAARCA